MSYFYHGLNYIVRTREMWYDGDVSDSLAGARGGWWVYSTLLWILFCFLFCVCVCGYRYLFGSCLKSWIYGWYPTKKRIYGWPLVVRTSLFPYWNSGIPIFTSRVETLRGRDSRRSFQKNGWGFFFFLVFTAIGCFCFSFHLTFYDCSVLR